MPAQLKFMFDILDGNRDGLLAAPDFVPLLSWSITPTQLPAEVLKFMLLFKGFYFLQEPSKMDKDTNLQNTVTDICQQIYFTLNRLMSCLPRKVGSV